MLPGAISDEVCREASDWLLQQSAAAERSGKKNRCVFFFWRFWTCLDSKPEIHPSLSEDLDMTHFPALFYS